MYKLSRAYLGMLRLTLEVLFYWFLNPCIYIQTPYSLPGHAEANIGSAVLLVSDPCIYIQLSTVYLGRPRLTLEVLFYWFLNPCIYVQTPYSLPGQAEANIGGAVLLVSEP